MSHEVRTKPAAGYVPPAIDDGIAFMFHVVLIWSAGGHTYGIDSTTRGESAARPFWMKELARHVKLVRP